MRLEPGTISSRDAKPGYPVTIADRFRKLPEAMLLTAGYYASRASLIGDLLRRR